MKDSIDRSRLMRELAGELMKEKPDRAGVQQRARLLGLKATEDIESMMIEVLSLMKKARPKSKPKSSEVIP